MFSDKPHVFTTASKLKVNKLDFVQFKNKIVSPLAFQCDSLFVLILFLSNLVQHFPTKRLINCTFYISIFRHIIKSHCNNKRIYSPASAYSLLIPLNHMLTRVECKCEGLLSRSFKRCGRV